MLIPSSVGRLKPAIPYALKSPHPTPVSANIEACQLQGWRCAGRASHAAC